MTGVSKKKAILFGLLFVMALMPRLLGITFHSLWFDEASTANMISQKNVESMLKALSRVEGTPPLFYLLEKGFIDLFHLPIDEFFLRFLPMVFGALSCVIYFLLFKEISSAVVARYAFVLVALSNFHINLSQEARSYSLFGLFALLSLCVTVLWWKRRSRILSLAIILSLVLTMVIHYYGLIWAAAVLCAVLLIKPKNRQMRDFFFLAAFSAVISFALLIPFFISQLHNEIAREYLIAKWLPGIVYSPIKVPIGAYLFKIKTVREISVADLIGIIPTAVIALIAVRFFIKRMFRKEIGDSEKIVVLSFILAFCVHVAIGWKFPTIHPRYMAHFLILLFGIILINAAHKNKLMIGAFVIIIGLNAVAAYKYFDPSPAYFEPWRDIVAEAERFISSTGTKEGPILADGESCLPISFYLKKKTSILYYFPNLNNPEMQFDYELTKIFGHEFFSPPFRYSDDPRLGRTSVISILNKYDRGIIVTRDPTRVGEDTPLLERCPEDKEISVLKVFKTNQGKIILYKWISQAKINAYSSPY
jgi:hypothetical protein